MLDKSTQIKIIEVVAVVIGSVVALWTLSDMKPSTMFITIFYIMFLVGSIFNKEVIKISIIMTLFVISFNILMILLGDRSSDTVAWIGLSIFMLFVFYGMKSDIDLSPKQKMKTSDRSDDEDAKQRRQRYIETVASINYRKRKPPH